MDKKPLRKCLDLASRIAVIEAVINRSESKRDLARRYKCSLTQIKNIIRRKDEYLHEWKNNGDLSQVSKKQSACFLTVGAIVCEFAHRWKMHGFEVYDEVLCEKGQEAAVLLSTPEVRTTKYWLERLKLRFKIFEPPDEFEYDIKRTLEIEDIIRDLMVSYSSHSKFPQLLDQNIIKPYLRESSVTCFSGSEGGSINGASIADNQKYYCPQGSFDFANHVKIENDITMMSDELPPKSPANLINSYKEALSYLSPLEEFVLLKEDVRATGLIDQLENLFKDNITNNF